MKVSPFREDSWTNYIVVAKIHLATTIHCNWVTMRIVYVCECMPNLRKPNGQKRGKSYYSGEETTTKLKKQHHQMHVRITCLYIPDAVLFITSCMCNYIAMYAYTCYSCNMGTGGLPDIYTGQQARGLRMYISGKPQVHVLQLLCAMALLLASIKQLIKNN